MEQKPVAAGRSSFDLVDRDLLFKELAPFAGRVLLDLACGRGTYTLALARHFSGQAKIYAVDLWKEGIEALRKDAAAQGITNIDAFVADISKGIPVGDRSIELCLAATVLHDLVEDGTEQGTLREVSRVTRPGGTLAVIEFKKMDGPPGPPAAIRLSPEELERLVAGFGFAPAGTIDIGRYTYLSLFKRGS